VTETGKNVKTITDHHKPAVLGRMGYAPATPKPPFRGLVSRKKQTGPAAMDYSFA